MEAVGTGTTGRSLINGFYNLIIIPSSLLSLTFLKALLYCPLAKGVVIIGQ
jgi:hypothetical protein